MNKELDGTIIYVTDLIDSGFKGTFSAVASKGVVDGILTDSRLFFWYRSRPAEVIRLPRSKMGFEGRGNRGLVLAVNGLSLDQTWRA